jgi:asparagine synthase (glutamine-hydrolysing)
VVSRWGLPATRLAHSSSTLDLDVVRRQPDVGFLATALMLAPLLSRARDKGIKVMLDGIGGDELLSAGVNPLRNLMREWRFGELVSETLRYARHYHVPALSLFLNTCVRPVIPRAIRGPIGALRRRVRGEPAPAWLEPGLTKRRQHPPGTDANGGPHFESAEAQRAYEVLFWGWNATVALGHGEEFISSFGLEPRRPFLDRRLIELVLSMPDEARGQGEWDKLILRRAMKGTVPEVILRRRDKAEFSAVASLELRERQAAAVEGLLRTSGLASLGLVRLDELAKAFERYRMGRISPTEKHSLEILWWLELWVRSLGCSGENGRRRTSDEQGS